MYHVYWGPELLAKISAAYNSANTSKRRAILDAVERIDAGLASEPLRTGESRHTANYRVLAEGPVFVHYRVNSSRNMVRITSVSISRR